MPRHSPRAERSSAPMLLPDVAVKEAAQRVLNDAPKRGVVETAKFELAKYRNIGCAPTWIQGAARPRGSFCQCPCDHPRPMTERTSPNVEVIDLAPGLWIWRLEHPAWNEHADWQEVVTCVCADGGSERWLLDPLLPPD